MRFENESLKWRMMLAFYSTHESTMETLTAERAVISLIIALENESQLFQRKYVAALEMDSTFWTSSVSMVRLDQILIIHNVNRYPHMKIFYIELELVPSKL